MKKTVLSISVATLLASTLCAEDVKLPTINVIGGSEESLSHIPGSSTVITQETLEETKPLSLQDALKKTSGVHAVETDGYGFYPRITIRGIGSDMSKKVLLLEDGAPIALGPYTDPAAYYHPPVERMERIEILKGSGSLAHGPSNIGGVINYITKQPRDGSSVVFTAGNYNYKSLLAEYGVVIDNYSFSISALTKEGDGWRDMPFDATDVVIKGALKLNDNNTLGIKLTHYEHEAAHTYLGLTQKEYEQDYKQNKAQNDLMFVERDSLDLTHQYFSDSGFGVKTLAYYNKATRDWWRQNNSFNSVTGYNDMNSNADGRLREFEVMGIDSRALFDYTLFDIDNSAEFGIKLHQETMKNQRGRTADQYTYVIDTSYTSGSYLNGIREQDTREAEAITLFAQNRLYIGENTTITPGFRVEKYEQTRKIDSWNGSATATSTKTDNTEFIPGIGATHKFAKEATLFGGVHKGFAPPRVADAIASDGDAVDLDAERSTNYEIGLRGHTQNANYEVTLFRLDFANQIAPNSDSGGQLTNAGETLNQGLELSGGVDLGAGFALSGNYTYLETAEIKSNNQGRAGNRLSYAPEHLLNLMANYKTASWGTGVTFSYVSEQFSDFDETEIGTADGKKGIIPSYNLWDVNAWYVLNKNAKLNLAIKNLTDETYIASRAPGGINPGMGLNAQASLKVSF
ncbi:MAG: TonB-dependent siderophore receptor [Helicobacteraceae bacterium]|nr:TonB-dependent siderophore receptor [Helicobacteraceae bacterium]